MAYIGQSIKNGTFSVLDTNGNTYNGSNTTFSLGTQVGSPAQLLVSHDGVIQKPGTDYTLATGGTQITFTTAPASGASIFIVEISGAVGGPINSDLNGNELVLDVDGDTSLHADTDDQIDVKVGGTDQFSIKNGSVDFNDDVKARFGNSNDLEIYHDGSGGSFIKDTGNGVLFIQTNGLRLRTTADESMIDTDENGSVALYHDNSKKLETTSGGLVVTGGINIGGTGAANLLDDYEFGTWSPSLSNFNTSGTVTTVGRYVKAGRMVTASGTMAAATSIAHDSSALVSGFPFAGPVSDFGVGAFTHHSVTGGNDEGILLCDLSSSRVFFPSSFNTTSSNQKVSFTVTYEASS